MSELHLPRAQRSLYDALLGRGDVAIVDLYDALGGPADRRGGVLRKRGGGNRYYPQCWLSPYITRLNRRLADVELRVEPGERRRTYRLVSTR